MTVTDAINNFINNALPNMKNLGRFDAHGIHHSWDYNPENEHELEVIKQLADYATAHNIPQRKLDVWTTQNQATENQIKYSIRSMMHKTTHDHFNHYLVYPDWVQSSPRNTSETYWSITFTTAQELDLDLTRKCAFARYTSCTYCQNQL